MQWWKDEYGQQFTKSSESQTNLNDWVASHSVDIVFPTYGPYAKGESTTVDQSFPVGTDTHLREYLSQHGYSGDLEGTTEKFTSNLKGKLIYSPVLALRIDRFVTHQNQLAKKIIHVTMSFKIQDQVVSPHPALGLLHVYDSFVSSANDNLVIVSWHRNPKYEKLCNGKEILNGNCYPSLGYVYINYYHIEK